MMCLGHIMLAQVPIARNSNSMRSGDVLCKVEVNYVSPGQRGSDQIWQLGEVSGDSRDVLQGIASNGDTIAIFEANRIHHYVVHGDTLFDKGEQQRRAYCIFDEERPVLHYPFQYSDSISGHYSGSGRDENTFQTSSGYGYTVADGTGMLTDGTDTIRHITRLHMYDDYTTNLGNQFTMRYRRHHYSWYCDGYRYPIMESFHWSVVDDTISMPIDSITYLFLPVQQMALGEDIVNDSILAEVALADAVTQKQASIHGEVSNVSATLSADGTKISIAYTMTGTGDISFCACDIVGNILGYAHYENREEGDWQEDLVLSRKPFGNVLMLNIKCGENEKNIKVYQ